MTDMVKHKVTVMGKFDPHKVMKKLRKKTGKAVEMVVNNKGATTKDATVAKEVVDKGATAKDATVAKDSERLDPNNFNQLMSFNCCKESAQLLVLFSDENPNACCIM